jgi:co-chaperonin GroES (HSP10)
MLKPLNDKIVVKEIAVEQTHSSGIILQGNVTGEMKRVRVTAIGKDVSEVKVDDVLLIDWQFAAKSTVDGDIIYVIKEENVIAVVEPD